MVTAPSYSCTNCGDPLTVRIQNNIVSIGCMSCRVVVFISRSELIKSIGENEESLDLIMDALFQKYVRGLSRVLQRRRLASEIIKSGENN